MKLLSRKPSAAAADAAAFCAPDCVIGEDVYSHTALSLNPASGCHGRDGVVFTSEVTLTLLDALAVMAADSRAVMVLTRAPGFVAALTARLGPVDARVNVAGYDEEDRVSAKSLDVLIALCSTVRGAAAVHQFGAALSRVVHRVSRISSHSGLMFSNIALLFGGAFRLSGLSELASSQPVQPPLARVLRELLAVLDGSGTRDVVSELWCSSHSGKLYGLCAIF